MHAAMAIPESGPELERREGKEYSTWDNVAQGQERVCREVGIKAAKLIGAVGQPRIGPAKGVENALAKRFRTKRCVTHVRGSVHSRSDPDE
jgi:hypothetical protein